MNLALDLKCYESHIGHADYLDHEAIILQASSNIREVVSNLLDCKFSM